MKKSLSVILSSAMALSMFSSVAFGATSADFTDLKDLDAATKAKFDALISAGIYDGVSATKFGLNDKMNRAQFAKVAALIYQLKVDTTLKTSSFSDVKADDPSNSYALPSIEAVKNAGITDGYAPGQFNPAGEVTKEQLATFLIRGLGKDAEGKATPGVSDKTVSDWAKGYVALALQLKLMKTDADGSFGGTNSATRSELVLASYEGKAQFEASNVPAKLSVTEAKATGVQKVQVTFNKAVDTEKAAVALTKGTAPVVTTIKWADDKKSATITLTDTKLSAGDYTVTLGGVDAVTIDKATATFTAQDEVIQKIDFVTAGDTIAFAKSVIVKARAVNQYGEAASTNAGSYNVYTSAASFTKITKDLDGSLLITLNTDTGSTTQGVSVIPVTIVNNDSHVTATKNFKLGTQQILSKLELGAARYSVGTSLSGKGENVKFDLNLFDQYGGQISYDTLTSAPLNSNATTLIWNNFISSSDVKYEIEDNGNNIPQVKISLLNNLDKSGDYTFTVFNQAATASGKLTVNSSKVATKIQLGDIGDVIASGDTDVYIPVIAYDAQGNQISANDLTSAENVGRITVSLSGAIGKNGTTTTTIDDSGEHKGSIRLLNVTSNAKGAVSVTAVIATANASSTATKTYTVADARVADHFKEITVPAKAIAAGADSKFKLNVIDNYGKKLDKSLNVDSVGNANAGGTHYSVTVSAITYTSAGAVVASPKLYVKDSATNTPITTTRTYDNLGSDFKVFNDEFKFVADPTGLTTEDHVEFTARIFKGATEISKITRTITMSRSTEDLTYSVSTLPTLVNTIDSKLVTGPRLVPVAAAGAGGSSDLAHEVKVTATNASGDTVALPGSVVQIRTSDQSVAQAAVGTDGKAYVLGNKVGTATLNVVYKTLKGDTKQANVPVTVKSESVSAATLTAGETKATVATGANAFTAMDLKVIDNYGAEWDKADLTANNDIIGITFSVEHIKNGTAAVDSTGVITGTTGTQTTFDLVATSPSGKSVSTAITIQ